VARRIAAQERGEGHQVLGLAEPPFDLSGVLADKLDLVLAGLTVPQSCES
jgi:hypothetical protein